MTESPDRVGRALLEARPLLAERGVSRHAEGSARIALGHTEVLATVSVEHRVPAHMRGQKEGWLMAEYSMLPRSTQDRMNRERNLQNGRRHEIQRLLGRSFRSALDLKPFRNQTLIIDCDVLEADGGTRVACVLAGYAALHDLSERLISGGALRFSPIVHPVGAVSVGLVGGEIRLDLDYAEDARASADLNVVATADGRLLEAQGGAEAEPLDPELYIALLRAGITGAASLLAELRRQIG
ncbi:ribonuclease PH [Deinococcus sp.]|uniref:ribonuclease PH n=1 Tax=Deinococcus sp. TaxID=47478 RepID=UPI003C7C7168